MDILAHNQLHTHYLSSVMITENYLENYYKYTEIFLVLGQNLHCYYNLEYFNIYSSLRHEHINELLKVRYFFKTVVGIFTLSLPFVHVFLIPVHKQYYLPDVLVLSYHHYVTYRVVFTFRITLLV